MTLIVTFFLFTNKSFHILWQWHHSPTDVLGFILRMSDKQQYATYHYPMNQEAEQYIILNYNF